MKKSLLSLLTAAALTLSSNLFGEKAPVNSFRVEIEGVTQSAFSAANGVIVINSTGTYANGKIVVAEKSISSTETLIEITNTSKDEVANGLILYTVNNEQLKQTFKIGNSKGLARSFEVVSSSSNK